MSFRHHPWRPGCQMRRASCAEHPLRPANPPTSGAMHPHAIVAAGPCRWKCRSELPFAAAAARPAAGMGSTPRPPPPDRSSRARARSSRSTKAAPTLHCLSKEARTHSSRSRCTHPTPLRLEARTRAASILPRYALAHALLTMPLPTRDSAHAILLPRLCSEDDWVTVSRVSKMYCSSQEQGARAP